ncbi:MAG: type II toxin-antitoxin system VapC family toxin [candidate division NC10 bacterium]|nr:type II toxin-antitoxin system VapC family toxin [candidate division NC10 bacterium]
MNLRYVLDTGWIIRHLRGSRPYTQTIRKIGSAHIGVSIVTLAELYEGVVRSTDPQAAEHALTTFLSDKTPAHHPRDLSGLRRAEG